MPKFTSALSIFLLLSTTACTVGPDYQAPQMSLPQWWHSLTTSGKPVAPTPLVKTNLTAPWWTNFHDKTLNYLIKQALSNNANAKVAASRITEARANYQTTSADRYPQLNATARDQNTREILFGSQSLFIRQYQAIFDASWELDLFGGQRRATEAARDVVQAREADLRAAQITLVGDVARNYVEWRDLQQQIVLTRQTAAAQKSLLDIADLKFKAGTGSYIEAAQASTLYKGTTAQIPELERQREASGYRLSVLLGENPGQLNTDLQPVKNLPQPINIPTLAAPAEIIRNRPDVQAAERQLAANTALQGEAFSALFPRVSLSGFFGINGGSLNDSPTDTWSIAPSVSVPLLDFGRIKGRIKAADARQEQAFQQYRNTVLNALSEVETNLTNVGKSKERVKLLQQTLVSANQSVDIARQRYESGLTNFTEVLDSEQQLYNTKTSLVQAQADLLAYLISLHKALAIAP